MGASESAPPGYSITLKGYTRTRALFGALLVSALIALGHEILIRQAGAYLAPGFGPPRGLTTLGAAVAALGAAAFGWRTRRTPTASSGLLVALSVLSTSSALLWFFAFGERALFPIVAFGVPALAAALLAATLIASLRTFASPPQAGEVFRYWLAPFRLFGLALGLSLVAGLLTVVGLLRSSACLGAVLAALALWSNSRKTLVFAYAALALSAAAFAGAELLVPIRDLRTHPPEIVHALGGARQRHVVVSVQSTFELFSDHELRASSIDGHRYAECLAHPALALAPQRTNVLLLGAADGLIEREILRYTDVAKLTVVTIDATPRKLAVRGIWSPGRVRAESELPPERLRVVEAEPIVWLDATNQKFDVILIDLPDPVGYREGKNFTLHFYRSLARHLTPDGSIALQVTSPLSSLRALSSIVATLKQASFAPLLYTAPVSSLGVWGFVWARHGAPPTFDRSPDNEAERVLATLRFLDAPRISKLFTAPDERPLLDAPFNTLPEQPVVELLHEERARLGL